MKRRTTIMDVAKMAGVGKVTVSYVLNGRSRDARISLETERKVREAAEALRYRPNGLARMLVTQRTSTIGVVFQYADLFSSGSGFINEVMRGVCAAAVAEGFDLMLHTKSVGSPEIEADVLSDGRVDGVLILRDQNDPTLEALLSRGFPAVQFFTRSDHPEAAWIDADNFAGARLAVRHLIDLGHQRIGMIQGPIASTPANDRFQGYRDAMETANLSVSEDHCVRCGNAYEVRGVLPELLKRPDRPTAFFAWSDEVALAALEVARSLEIRVPDDLSVVGFDSLDLCNRSVPPLTSVRQPVYEMAAEATRLLVSILRQEELPRKRLLFPLSLDIRGSSAPALIPSHKEVNP